jgi:hypothetical protein
MIDLGTLGRHYSFVTAILGFLVRTQLPPLVGNSARWHEVKTLRLLLARRQQAVGTYGLCRGLSRPGGSAPLQASALAPATILAAANSTPTGPSLLGTHRTETEA